MKKLAAATLTKWGLVSVGLALLLVAASALAIDSLGAHIGDIRASGSGSGFDGTLTTDLDVNGNDIVDGTDTNVTLGTGLSFCVNGASCMDLSTDDQVSFDKNATGSNTFNLKAGNGWMLDGSALGTVQLFRGSDGITYAQLKAGSVLTTGVGTSTEVNLQLDDTVNLGAPGSSTGTIGWNGSGTAAGEDIRFGCVRTSATENWCGADAQSNWGGTSTQESTFKMGSMMTTRTLETCDAAIHGVINTDHDLTTPSESGRSVQCVAEYDGAAESYAWRSVVDNYGSIYVSTSGDVTYDAGGFVKVTGGTIAWSEPTLTDADQSGFDLVGSGGGLTPLLGADGRYMAVWQISFSGTSGNNLQFSLSNNNGTGVLAQCTSERDLSGTSVGSVSGTCIFDVSYAGDTTDDIYPMVDWTAGSANITIDMAQIVLRRL